MNSKKNKNKNKPKPNPNPTQTEIVLEKTDGTADVKEDSKSDERVPEIVSDVVTPVEVKCSEEDLPKKPKRNRGKKKKGEADDEITEQKVIDTAVEQSEVTDVSNVVKTEVSAPKVEKEEVTPATRKKKNKGKKGDDQSVKPEAKPISPLPVDSKLDIAGTQAKPATPEVPGEETKSGKKKNKKKKRNDSERSDKAEEISCTAVFLKILEPREDKKDAMSLPEPKQAEEVGVIAKETEVKIDIPEASSKKDDVAPHTELPKDEGAKGKKKNKKDKKQQSKSEVEERATPIQMEVEAIQMPVREDDNNINISIKQELPKDLPSEITLSPEEAAPAPVIPIIEKEKSPKPKPKIAKPVEKKKKDNIEDKSTKSESIPSEEVKPIENVSLGMILKEDKPTPVPTQPMEAPKREVIVLPGIEETKKQIEAALKQDIQPESTKTEIYKEEETKQTERINIPEIGGSKKRKKSPKPKRNMKCFMPFETDLPAMTETQKESVMESKSQAETTDVTSLKEKIIPETKEQIMTAIPLVFESNPESTEVKKESDLPKSPSDLPKSPSVLETPSKAEQVPLPVCSKGKKGKSSPKLPKKLDIKMAEEKTGEESNKSIELKKDDKHSVETPFDLPLLEDIEIRSVKDESDGSICDIAPEVQPPRASSQIEDSNNNQTVIQEITSGDTLNVPIIIPETPFIQSSGDAPIITSEIIPEGIRITEIETKKTEEKTDIKSKMMEVNKDMEDLRKSIERSLAELTAIEKSEQDIEQKFEDKQTKKDEKKTDETVEKITKPIQSSPQEIAPPKIEIQSKEKQTVEVPKTIPSESVIDTGSPPVIPSRKDNKGKNKSKKGKGKHEPEQATINLSASESGTNISTTSGNESKTTQETKTEEKTDQKSKTEEKGKQQSDANQSNNEDSPEAKSDNVSKSNFEPIESFEDALTSSTDDVNKSFEIIANNDNDCQQDQENSSQSSDNPKTSVTEPDEEKIDKKEKNNPVSPSKNLLGHPDIPARLNKTDYKKEKNKPPNTRQARVKIKDSNPVEIKKESKESQTDNKRLLKPRKSISETVTCMTNENEEYVYKYSFRKVFLPSACQVCKKDLSQSRFPCGFCNLIFYCSQKHKDEDYSQHQALCFAVSTIVHLKDQKHIYADCQNITGQDYRLLRMQNIISCEKILKRSLAAWEQEVLLYPRICADVTCREWRQSQLKDCEGCGQVSFCKDNPDHLPKTHQRWCKSYLLYKKLVTYQQTIGRLEPKLPSRVMSEHYQIPDKFNEVLASLYEEKIDMNDIQYAALTQIATAPLTAAYCYQLYKNKMNATFANGNNKKSTFTIHVVNAELQFEADALNKWEVFFLHLCPDLMELKVVLIGKDLNPSNLPLELLGKIKMCAHCRLDNRRVVFEFQDKKTYTEYFSYDYTVPDLVCAFNPSIQRSTIYNGKDLWPSAIKCITKLKAPFIITSYTQNELIRDVSRIKEITEDNINVVLEPNLNTFASVRPDRNFITDDEIPLLFKNYFVAVVCGGF